jgi:hypothetical protein
MGAEDRRAAAIADMDALIAEYWELRTKSQYSDLSDHGTPVVASLYVRITAQQWSGIPLQGVDTCVIWPLLLKDAAQPMGS